MFSVRIYLMNAISPLLLSNSPCHQLVSVRSVAHDHVVPEREIRSDAVSLMNGFPMVVSILIFQSLIVAAVLMKATIKPHGCFSILEAFSVD
jgi:hypothetical protein